MDENESDEIEQLLRSLGTVSKPDLRRFAIDCAKRSLAVLKGEVAQAASELLSLAEKRAAGTVSPEHLEASRKRSSQIYRSLNPVPDTVTTSELAYSAASECVFTESAITCAIQVSGSAARAVAQAAAEISDDASYDVRYMAAFRAERIVQAKLLRQSFGES